MKGFVFGKFLPFHKGHQALIEFAARQCDELTVLICCSDREKIPASYRFKWIADIFEHHPKVRPLLVEYREAELPNSSVSSVNISRLWSTKFKALLPEVDIVVTSEPYGDYVAEYMNIRHIPFDPPRQQVPISATLIRKNPFKYWDYLPDNVKPYYQCRIVLSGTESTGKSSLAAVLSRQLNAPYIAEAGRDLIPDSSDFTEADLYKVAEEHSSRVGEALAKNPPILILDTDIYTTQSYAHFSFGHYLNLPDEFYNLQKGDIYLYLNKDAPYIQDGTRLPKSERDALDVSHRATLAHFGIEYIEIGGSDWAERQAAVWEQLELAGLL